MDEVGPVGAGWGGLDLACAELGIQGVAIITFRMDSYLAGTLAVVVHHFLGTLRTDRLGKVDTLARV